MLGRFVVYALALPLFAMVGCGGDGGDDGADTSEDGATDTDPTTTPTSGGSVDASDTQPASATSADAESGTGECGAGMNCMAPVPQDWFGPAVFARGDPGDDPPECGDGYPDAGLTLFEGYADPGPAGCTCDCQVNMLVLCNVNTYEYLDSACTMFGKFGEITAGCVDFEIEVAGQFVFNEQGPPVCQREIIEDLPDPDWGAQINSCRVTEDYEPVECSTGVCTPTPPDGFESQVCVFAPGDHDCPGSDFTEKFAWLSGFEDSRSCSDCECGAPGAATCTGATAQYYDGAMCGGNLLADEAPNTCSLAAGGAVSVGVTFPGAASCAVSVPSEPQGGATPTGEFTFCCLP